jgi:hypothetical protein
MPRQNQNQRKSEEISQKVFITGDTLLELRAAVLQQDDILIY